MAKAIAHTDVAKKARVAAEQQKAEAERAAAEAERAAKEAQAVARAAAEEQVQAIQAPASSRGPTSDHNEEDVDWGRSDDAAQVERHREREEEEQQQQHADPDQELQPQDLVATMPTVVRMPTPSGQGWVWSGKAAEDEVVQVLEWRDVEFAELDAGLGAAAGPAAGATSGRPGVVLPFKQQKAIHDKHWRQWLQDPKNKEKLEKVEERHDGVHHRMIRDQKAMYRAGCFEKMGGTDWLYVLVAIGTLDDVVMMCMNEAGVDGWFAMDMAKFAMVMAKLASGLPCPGVVK